MLNILCLPAEGQGAIPSTRHLEGGLASFPQAAGAPSWPAGAPTAADLAACRPFLEKVLARHGVPRRDRADVAQDVLTVAFRAIRAGRFQPPPGREPARALEAWLYGIAWRCAFHYRQSAYVRLVELLSEFPPDLKWFDPVPRIEARSDVLAIRHLGTRNRKILIARGDGVTLVELGEICGTPLATTARHVKNARALLSVIIDRRGAT